MRERIGILGGSFDPIHTGHLIIAQDAYEQFALDRVLFTPAHHAPLKEHSPHAPTAQRLEMARLAIEGEPRFALSEIDSQPASANYSIDTVKTLRSQFPRCEFFWILGGDQIAQLHLWREIETLAQLVSFIAFERPDSQKAPSSKLPGHARILYAKSRQLDLSSTEIRDRLKSGRSAKYFLPAKVFDHIKAENLYR